MYVCICIGVTDREIRRCAERGVCTLGELQMELGVGTQCGCCRGLASQLLEEHGTADSDLAAQPA